MDYFASDIAFTLVGIFLAENHDIPTEDELSKMDCFDSRSRKMTSSIFSRILSREELVFFFSKTNDLARDFLNRAVPIFKGVSR